MNSTGLLLAWMHFWGALIFFAWLQDIRQEKTAITIGIDIAYSLGWPLFVPVLTIGTAIWNRIAK